ncbi:MAG: amino acid adenylation domain-containing protein, partial [Acidobacteria bacterium]|nr:amino acid adenylation domain-containing protein [Acidobacteriota bacterium]
EKLVEELQPERDLDRSPLFQVLFVLQNAGGEPPKLPDLVFEALGEGSQRANFDLTFQAEEMAAGIDLMLEYRAEVFDGSTMERWLEHFRNLLVSALGEPQRNVFELSLLTAQERQQLVVEWSSAPVHYPREASVIGLFAETAGEYPDSVAVVAGDRSLTYAELAAQVDRLALWLRDHGVGPEVRVGLCVDRSLDMVVAHLAILQAGGAYVPLAPEYPEERLRFMVEDSGAALVLTQEGLDARLPADGAPKFLLEAVVAEASAREAVGASFAAPDPLQLAYVMYTSGSTGRPKGVAIPHRGIVRLVRGANYADLGPDEVFLQLAPMSFDLSTLELWAPLLNGGRVVLMPPEKPSPESVEAAIRDFGVTTIWLTAGFFHVMVDERLEGLRPLRQLLAGGDVLSPHRVRQVLELEGGPRVIDGYGPTENTTFTSCHGMDAADEVGTTVSIGRPVSNSWVFVLDRFGQLVPAGVAGELYTGGDGLARGYAGRPALTAERFVPDAFGVGERLYRTGDVVRWVGEGRLEFLGRSDQQVKVRGFRIEPGEVEAAMLARPEVGQAVVTVFETAGGDKRLVAYVVPAAGHDVDTTVLRHRLSEELPDFMVPGAIVKMAELPLSANNKLDRKALPAPDVELTRAAAEYVAPRGPLEGIVAEIWAQVLEVQRVGRGEDFFALGGHSLLATQVMSRIRQALAVEAPLRLLFESPTVAGMARGIEDLRRSGTAGPKPPALVPVPRDGELPLSFAQQRLWFIDQLEPDSPTYNIPMPMLAEGPLDLVLVERALTHVRQRHESLRTRFEELEGRPVQVVDEGRELPLPVIDLGGLPSTDREAELARLVDRDAQTGFDLARGPLLRARAVRLAPQSNAILFTMHHIVSDGWSVGVLVEEVSTIYQALR